MSTPARLVVLDRDGVLNRLITRGPGETPESPLSLEEVELLPGVASALARLTHAGFVVAVATNQPAAAKGKLTREALDAIHAKVIALAEAEGGRIARSFICYHRAEDGCACRKPRPGLLLDALAAFPGAVAPSAWMVGDRATDVLAGHAAGFRTAYIGNRFPPRAVSSVSSPISSEAAFPGDEETLRKGGTAPFFRGRDLQHFVDALLREPALMPLSIKLFSDGADLPSLLEMAKDPRIAGFTTNPTLMRKAGVSDYVAFAQQVLTHIKDRPISFEVFADEFSEMARQAKTIAAWGPNVYVKIPITNTRGESSLPLVQELSVGGRVQLNVTAICTLEQVLGVTQALKGGAPAVVSVFAGRIADTGRDPVPLMQAARAICDASGAQAELLWASPRELLNILQAEQAGAHIITVPPDMLKKMSLFGKSLGDYSLDTVKMFYGDAQAAGFKL